MKYGSVCSGIEAATAAWHPLGWEASFFSEIEKFPRHVLAHHYPNTPLHGDFTTIQKDDYEPIELLVGGTPCQSFSVAGLRAGLADPRGNLMLEFGALAKRLQPKWLVWENVSGVLSSNGGRDFGSFLAMLGELGYGFAYRVLDAQHFGVPQRRRRVFVIGCLGDFGSAAAVLFEQHSLQGHIAPSREKRQEITEVARTLAANGGGLDRPAGQGNELDFCVTWPAQIAPTLNASFGSKQGLENQHINGGAGLFVPSIAIDELAQTLTKSPSSYSSYNHARQEGNAVLTAKALTKKNQRNDPDVETLLPVSALAGNTIGRKPENGGNGNGYDDSGVSYTLTKTDVHAVAFNAQGSSSQGDCVSEKITPTLDKSKTPAVMHKMQVRRLMPIECERLQGFSDNFTNIPGASDSARYKALGNSMAVPCMVWIGKRIKLIDDMQKAAA